MNATSRIATAAASPSWCASAPGCRSSTSLFHSIESDLRSFQKLDRRAAVERIAHQAFDAIDAVALDFDAPARSCPRVELLERGIARSHQRRQIAILRADVK